MKTFLGLRGLFVLLSLIWNCAGDWTAMQVKCSNFWFYVRIKPTLFHNLYMDPEEVFLGDDCPVTRVVPDGFYEFFYHPHECGITVETLQQTLLFKSKIKYMPSISNDRAEMPLSCVAHNHHPLLNEIEGSDNETNSSTESEWEIKMRIQITNLGKRRDEVAAFGVRPWGDLNVTFSYISMMYLFHKRRHWVLQPYS